jgi:Holliday junction DNA helicase RuvA
MRDKVEQLGSPSLRGQKIEVESSPRSEAVDALVALGYKANEVNKLISKLDIDGLSAEDIIRQALKQAAA